MNMEPRKLFLASPSFSLALIFFLITISLYVENASSEEQHHVEALVEKGQRRKLFVTDYGEVSAIDVMGGHGAPFHHLQFITLDPNSVFLPVLLHADMVFYVQTGSGRLSWANEEHSGNIGLREGDVCKVGEGSVFYIQSNLEAERKKLRIYALFANTDDNTYDPLIGAYSRINDLVKGFDRRIIQAAFKVPEDLVEAITNKTDTPAIVHAAPEEHHRFWELEASVLRNFIGFPTNTKKVKTYNIHEKGPDFKNCHGWSLTVTKKQLKTLKHTDIGFLMVNLTQGSMLGPHWNPRGTEIAVVLQGEGMVRVQCGSSNDDNTEECQNSRFRVKEGDVFVVPRFHPMAHMSFNNDSLVFMGFSTSSKKNHPQFLAGKTSVLGMINRQVMAMALGVSNTTADQLLKSQDESIIFGCISCAEEEERIMEEEMEERRRKEEEERERQEEEEEERRREEEKRRKEEERKREEEEEEEEARREEEERRRREEEEEEAKREREEEKESEEEQGRREQERRERRRQEEEARKEIERRKREEAARREMERRREEEEAAAREQERARRQQERRERRKREEGAERERERRGEEEAEREEEQAREEEEEAIREQEQARRQQERRERRRRQEEEERARQEEEEGEEEEPEEWGRRGRGRGGGGGGGGRRRRQRGQEEEEEEEDDEPVSEWEWEQEEARRQQQERERRRHQHDHLPMNKQVKEAKGKSSGSEGRRVLKMQKNV